jgi:hypothetical protein
MAVDCREFQTQNLESDVFCRIPYCAGTPLHSLFSLGINEESSRGFRSNISRSTFHAEYILATNLIVSDEVSILTPWVANRVSMTLQSISLQREMDFGGRTSASNVRNASYVSLDRPGSILALNSQLSTATANESFRSCLGRFLAANCERSDRCGRGLEICEGSIWRHSH